MDSLVVTWDPGPERRQVVAGILEGVAEPVFLPDLDAEGRRSAIRAARAMLSRHTGKELDDEERALTAHLELIQYMSAGIDFIPLEQLPPGVPIAGNGGAYAEPMAEHALAMVLAAAKRLLVEHAMLAKGEFRQFKPSNRVVRGMTAGILGFGGIGIATARLFKAVGMQVHAINRRGHSDESLDWIGTPDRLDEMLAASDVLILSLPLTARTEKLIDARALAVMKPDAILVNLARGEIVDEAALYQHLVANPDFTACIDAWWIEPVRHDEFRMDHPFTDLPNVIGSPHNSASVGGTSHVPISRATSNCRRLFDGEPPRFLIGADERAPRAG